MRTNRADGLTGSLYFWYNMHRQTKTRMGNTNNPETQDRYVVVLTKKEGGTHEKFFETGKHCHKYLSRHR